MHNKLEKAQIRQTVRQQRQQVSVSYAKRAQHKIAESLSAHRLIHSNQHIACFLSFDGEIATDSVLATIEKMGGWCYLPKLRPYRPNKLWFLPYHANAAMRVNRYGIPEVDLSVNHAIRVSQLDVVFLPLVAFDTNGNRLGMGGGFYDATFAHLKNQTKRPRFIGLAYQLQMVNDLPSDPWDLPLDGVCTEENFYTFNS